MALDRRIKKLAKGLAAIIHTPAHRHRGHGHHDFIGNAPHWASVVFPHHSEDFQTITTRLKEEDVNEYVYATPLYLKGNTVEVKPKGVLGYVRRWINDSYKLGSCLNWLRENEFLKPCLNWLDNDVKYRKLPDDPWQNEQGEQLYGLIYLLRDSKNVCLPFFQGSRDHHIDVILIADEKRISKIMDETRKNPSFIRNLATYVDGTTTQTRGQSSKNQYFLSPRYFDQLDAKTSKPRMYVHSGETEYNPRNVLRIRK